MEVPGSGATIRYDWYWGSSLPAGCPIRPCSTTGVPDTAMPYYQAVLPGCPIRPSSTTGVPDKTYYPNAPTTYHAPTSMPHIVICHRAPRCTTWSYRAPR